MPAGLHCQKRGVEADSNQREKFFLCVRQGRTGRGLSEIRQDQRQHHQGDDDGEIGVGALKIVLLLAMAPTAEEQRQADHAVEDDHHHGEQSVPRQARIVRAMQHHGGDAGDLDEGDRESEEQRPQGFAEARGQVFRVADHCERRAQNRREQP